MTTAFFIPEKYDSRYSLLGAFCREVGEACREMGIAVNPAKEEARDARRVYVMFNAPASMEVLGRWFEMGGEPTAIVQWLVDHPFHGYPPLLNKMNDDKRCWLALAADDDGHMVNLKWPGVKRVRLWHGVSRGALCGVVEGEIERSHRAGGARDIDVLLAGSIASHDELGKLQAQVPSELHKACEQIVQLRLGHPWVGFGQAFDVAMPSFAHTEDQWGLMSVVFRFTTAWLNRERRLRVVAALKGLKVVVLGGEAWKSVDMGDAKFVGEAAYEDMPRWMARTKVCVCLNPTQFTHGFSERLLLSMAGGAASVSDDRLWVRNTFGASGAVRMFDLGRMETLRGVVEGLLGDAAGRGEMGVRGRAVVEKEHLWVRRVGDLMRLPGIGG